MVEIIIVLKNFFAQKISQLKYVSDSASNDSKFIFDEFWFKTEQAPLVKALEFDKNRATK